MHCCLAPHQESTSVFTISHNASAEHSSALQGAPSALLSEGAPEARGPMPWPLCFKA